MNIFYIDRNPLEAAKCLGDKHVVKMILETGQILSTAHRVLDGSETIVLQSGRRLKKYLLNDFRDDILYKSTHINHPSSIWARETSGNYLWLLDHFFALGDEYTHRYGKVHATISKLEDYVCYLPELIQEGLETVIPSCMDKEFIISKDPVENYRNYYKVGKSHLHKYTNREAPIWL